MSGKTIKCDMCGANLNFRPGQTAVTCPYCGTQQWNAAHGNAAEPPPEKGAKPQTQQGSEPRAECRRPRQDTAREQQKASGGALAFAAKAVHALRALPTGAYKAAGIASAVLFLANPVWPLLVLTGLMFWHPWTYEKRYQRQRKIYNEALRRFTGAKRAEEFEEAKAKFMEIPTFADAADKVRECEDRIRGLRMKEARHRENAEELKNLAKEAAASLLGRMADKYRR